MRTDARMWPPGSLESFCCPSDHNIGYHIMACMLSAKLLKTATANMHIDPHALQYREAGRYGIRCARAKE